MPHITGVKPSVHNYLGGKQWCVRQSQRHSPTMDPAVSAVMVIVLTVGEEIVTLFALGVVAVMVLAIWAQIVSAVVCKEEAWGGHQNQSWNKDSKRRTG